MKNVDILNFINEIAPFKNAYHWDNVGFLVGDIEKEVTGIVVCMDATNQVLAEAKKLGASLIITHHPIIFKGEKSFTTSSLCYQCGMAGVSVISAHTNLDVSSSGINFALATSLGLKNITQLVEEKEIVSDEKVYIGYKGELEEPMTDEEFARKIAKVTGLPPRFNGSDRKIKTVGLCGGSGYDILETALKQGEKLDGFITAEVKHDKFVLAQGMGVTIFDGGHHATEMVGMHYLADVLKERFADTSITVTTSYTGQLTTV